MPKTPVAIIIPAYNEAKVLKNTLKDVKATLAASSIAPTLIVINDGSTDQTQSIAEKYADVVLTHRVNRGLGAALSTGIEYVKRSDKFQHLVTFDSDGQHNSNDIIKAVKSLTGGFDVVIGSRFLHAKQQFPKMRKVVLKLSNFITYLFFQVWTTDSQSGFRALDAKAFHAITLHANRMEVSSEFFAEIKKHHLKFTEIPITVKYTDYSLAKGQSNLNSMRVLVKLLYKVFQ